MHRRATRSRTPYQPPYFHPGQSAPEIEYMHERRKALGGYLPERRSKYVSFALPEEKTYGVAKTGSVTQEVATTMAFVRLLRTFCARQTSATESCQSSQTKHAHSEWMPSFQPPKSTTLTAKTTFQLTESFCFVKESPAGQILHTGIKRGQAQWQLSPPLPPAMQLRVSQRFRSMCSTPCSDSTHRRCHLGGDRSALARLYDWCHRRQNNSDR
jgi:pyruvate dehydrogenase complex dehydrogenase (E1) component